MARPKNMSPLNKVLNAQYPVETKTEATQADAEAKSPGAEHVPAPDPAPNGEAPEKTIVEPMRKANREKKTMHVNLLVRPSFGEYIKQFAWSRGMSLNEAAFEAFSEWVVNHGGEPYKDIKG